MASVGQAYVQSIGNDFSGGIEKWFEAVDSYDEHMLVSFRNRIAGVGNNRALTPMDEAQIELDAMIDHFKEDRIALREQGAAMMAGSKNIAEIIDATHEFDEIVNKRWARADFQFKAQVVIIYGEAKERFGCGL